MSDQGLIVVFSDDDRSQEIRRHLVPNTPLTLKKTRGIVMNILKELNIHKTIVLLLVVILSGCSSANGHHQHDFADRVLTNAKVYTVNPKQPWAEAVAINMALLYTSAIMPAKKMDRA